MHPWHREWCYIDKTWAQTTLKQSDPGELHYEREEALGIPYPRDSQTFLVHDTSRV